MYPLLYVLTLMFLCSYNYKNPGAMEMYSVPNGGVPTYRSYSHGSGLDQHASHHYESAADVNTYLERGRDYGGGDHSQYHNSLHGSQPLPSLHHSQSHPSQPLQQSQPYPTSLSHHHSQASALTDIFQKTTLPELSPMSYSLTANPHHSDTLYFNTMPASDVSLREPTMFALRLQQEESKSTHGSRLSINGSKTSIHNSMHGSKPSMYSSRASNIHGSRPLVFNSGTSRESLLLRGGGKEHSIDDEAATLPQASQLSDRFPSPAFPLMNPSTENTDLPTRDSPLPRLEPLEASHGKKDFASLTCITNDHRRMTSSSNSPLESPLHSEVEGTPVHRKLSKRRDLSSLTSLDFMSGAPMSKENRGGTIIEEEEASQGSKVNSDKAKEDSPAIKKTRSKRLSRLEKLTSLDYIRQSFRLKKKKVSFQQSLEDTPKLTGRKSSSGRGHSDTVITNNQAQGIHDDSVAPEKPRGRMEWHQARRNSSTSTDVFSPTENMARHMYLQHHHHAFPDPHAAMAMSYTPQLSQPSYFLPPHMSGAPGMPMHPHMYPPGVQLSQQFYPSQLSQGYPYHPPGFMGEVHMSGRGFPRDMAPPNGSRADPRYQEVVTPDYSDVTSSDHEPSKRQRRVSMEEEEDYFRRHEDIGRYEDSTSPTNHTPDTDTEAAPDSSRLEYSSGLPPASPQRYGNGYPGNAHQGRHLDTPPTGQGGEGVGLSRYATPMSHIPQDMYQNSISVDDPPSTVNYHGNTRQHYSAQASPQMEQRRSEFSDMSEHHNQRQNSSGSGNKGRVSWHTTLATYSQDNASPELSRL